MFLSSKDFIDLSGRRFGKYYVIDFAEVRISRSGAKCHYWLVSCSCKRRKVVSTNSLRIAQYKKCDCVTKKEVQA